MRRATILSAIAALAFIAVASGACSSKSSSARTLSLTTVQRSGFFPHHPTAAGDQLGVNAAVSGARVGDLSVVCTFVTAQASVCNGQYALGTSSISTQSVGDTTGPPARASVTGGTGIYKGARGSVTVKRLNSCQPGTEPCRTQDVFSLSS